MFFPRDIWSQDAIFIWEAFSIVILPIIAMLCAKKAVPRQRYHAAVLLLAGAITQFLFCPWTYPGFQGPGGYVFIGMLQYPSIMDTPTLTLNILKVGFIALICIAVKHNVWSSEDKHNRERIKAWWEEWYRDIKYPDSEGLSIPDNILTLYYIQDYVETTYTRILKLPEGQRTVDEARFFPAITKAHEAFAHFDLIGALEALSDIELRRKNGEHVSPYNILCSEFSNYMQHHESW